MGKITFDISVSLDGFVAGPNDDPDNGLGDGGEALHEWVTVLESWREMHGYEGGEKGPDSDVLEESFANVGAVIVGRRMFDNAREWGDEPPFGVPVFVVTHRERESFEKGGTTFHFVDGVETALEQAREAAGDKDVAIGGGASVIQQYLGAGLVDEFQLHVVPLALGGGVRLFEDGLPPQAFEKRRVIDSPAVTHLKYRPGQR
jgi:dihydrofolate reductase